MSPFEKIKTHVHEKRTELRVLNKITKQDLATARKEIGEGFRALVGGKNSENENHDRGKMSVNEAMDIADEDQAYEDQTLEHEGVGPVDEDLELNEFLNKPIEVNNSLQEALQAEIAQLEKSTRELDTEVESGFEDSTDVVEDSEIPTLTEEIVESDEEAGEPEVPTVTDQIVEADEITAPEHFEKQLDSESALNELKAQIEEINTLVQTSQLDTRSESAEQQVTELEQQIYNIKNAKVEDSVGESEKTELSEESPERSQWRQLKVEFKQAEKEYYEALSENASTGAKWFGLGRADMNPQLKEAHRKFTTANTDFYKSAQKNGVYDRVARFASRKSAAEQGELSAGTLVAERHIFKPAEERLERQTASFAMPEGIRNLKEKVAGKIKNHKVAAGLTGGIALTAAAAFAAPVLATMAAGATVGFATKYASKSLLTKGFVNGREKSLEEQSSVAIDMIRKKNLYDLETLENEIFAAKNSIQQRKTAVSTASRAAGIGGAMAAGGFTADALADNVVAPDLEAGEISVDQTRSYAKSPEYSDPQSWGQDYNNETPDYSDVNPGQETAVTGSAPAQGLERAGVDVAAPLNESLPSAFEKVEAIHTIAGGENLSSVLFNHLNTLVDNGLTLPEGVGEDEVAHYMYESFPELTSATDAAARLTPEQWVELGIESGNPNEVYPGETIDLNALVEMMNESSVEATLETPVLGIQEAALSADVPADKLDITWWGDQSEIQIADEAMTENDAGINPDTPHEAGPEGAAPSESSGWESADTAVAPEIDFKTEDFDNLLETVGATHDFTDGPSMWNHLLGIMDEMSFENKQKYFEGLVVDDALGVPVEQDHYAWLKQNMPETGGHWMDLGGSDRLTPEQWEYAGVPSGDPQDLTGAVLDHSKLFDVLFNKEFDVSEALNESSDAIGSEVSGTSPETAATETPITDSAEEVVSNVPESYTEMTRKFTKNDESVHDYLVKIIEQGRQEGAGLPEQLRTSELMIDGVDYSNDVEAYVLKKLPDVSMSLSRGSSYDVLSPEVWKELGASSGNPTNLIYGEELQVGKLLEFIATDSPITPESLSALSTPETVLPEVDTSAEGFDEIRSQLQAIKEKFANPGPDGTVSTNARELAIRAWDGGDFTLDTAPTTTGNGTHDGVLNSFRQSIAEGSSGSQEFFGSTLKKEIWVQPDGSIHVVSFNPGGGMSFTAY